MLLSGALWHPSMRSKLQACGMTPCAKAVTARTTASRTTLPFRRVGIDRLAGATNVCPGRCQRPTQAPPEVQFAARSSTCWWGTQATTGLVESVLCLVRARLQHPVQATVGLGGSAAVSPPPSWLTPAGGFGGDQVAHPCCHIASMDSAGLDSCHNVRGARA